MTATPFWTAPRIWTAVILTATALFFYLTKGILLPFLAGLAVAYFLDPVADKLEEKGVSRSIATVLVLLFFFLIIVGVFLAMWPIIQSQIAGAIIAIPKALAAIRPWFTETATAFAERFNLTLETDIDQILSQYSGTLLDRAKDATGSILRGGLAFFSLLSLLIISPVVAFYMLRDWDLMVAKANSWLPPKNAGIIREQLKLVDEVLAGFVRGQVLVSLAMGTLYAIGWSLVGLDFGLLLGVLAGVLAFVPFVGSLFAVFIALLIGLGQWGADPLQLGLVLGVFGIVQVIESAFLTPKFVGERIGLHPVWVLFSVFAGGELMGFVGVLLALPAAAAIAVLVRFVIDRYLEHHEIGNFGLPAADSIEGTEKNNAEHAAENQPASPEANS
ncbi:AI-2E family transporter [Kordiimonas sediminis]|uniref:AI-2E family transporter n=1 Tax=Kordiimonas sediminis TaxID=1735581 RepID=UPI00174AEB23|nr:AI-2E family transporter [Kordiimonas sediminis]